MDLDDIVGKIVELPTLPQVVSTIIDLVEDPESSAEDINRVMERDQALAAKILKLVNSAFYGLPNRISSIRQAIIILGFSTVRSLAISASVFDMFGRGRARGHFSRENFWVHSISCACLARVVCARAKGVDKETAFVLGLLHDVGKLVLDRYAGKEFGRIVDVAHDEELPLRVAEQKILGTDHARIGARLAERWKLSEALTEGIRRHHDLASAAAGGVGALVASCQFANFAAAKKQFGHGGDFCEPQIDPEAWGLLGVAEADLAAIVDPAVEDIAETARMFTSLAGG